MPYLRKSDYQQLLDRISKCETLANYSSRLANYCSKRIQRYEENYRRHFTCKTPILHKPGNPYNYTYQFHDPRTGRFSKRPDIPSPDTGRRDAGVGVLIKIENEAQAGSEPGTST